MVAPAATRNAEAICDLLLRHAPVAGEALEIASGTGQHIAHFAKRFPNLTWHPTEIAPERLASIAAYAAEAGLSNLQAPTRLDATTPGWHRTQGQKDLVIVINLLHLISTPEAHILIGEAARCLTAQGRLILYGPFKRDGALTSDGDRRFDAELRKTDPEIGYKNDTEIREKLAACGLERIETVEMPANNLAMVASRADGDASGQVAS
jgi:cyclopropane fatty-acyl-phospholipid synthase-like methyltransferase